MRFPVRFEHLPASRNHALPARFDLAGPLGISADEMCAANEAGRKATSGETVESRVTPPDKDAIGRACLFDDLLDNRKKIKRLLRQPERHA